MNLKTWFLTNIARFGGLVLRLEPDYTVLVNDEADYDKKIRVYGESLFKTFALFHRNESYFGVFKNTNDQYIFKCNPRTEYKWQEFFYYKIVGTDNPIETLQNIYPQLLEKNCNDCPCFNDKLVTGQCLREKFQYDGL